MRQKFPDGSGGPFMVPGAGVVIGGEPFDYPELISACVPVEDGQDDDGDAEDGSAPDGPQAALDAAEEDSSAPPAETTDKTRAKGTRR